MKCAEFELSSATAAIVAGLFLLTVSSGCDSNGVDDDGDETVSVTLDLSGTITDFSDGTPVPDARVYIAQPGPLVDEHVTSVDADSRGRYSLQYEWLACPMGKVSLHVYKEGYKRTSVSPGAAEREFDYYWYTDNGGNHVRCIDEPQVVTVQLRVWESQ